MPTKRAARPDGRAKLEAAIRKWAPRLSDVLKTNPQTKDIDAGKLLTALACVESSFGANVGPRFEAAYFQGGRYFEGNPQQQDLVRRWGNLAAMSWGAWQIMYPTAVELGLNPATSPDALDDPDVSAPLVIKYLEKRSISARPPWTAKNLPDLFDAYNSGRAGDRVVPAGYIQKALRAYADPSPWMTEP